jgi:hypothetical protein
MVLEQSSYQGGRTFQAIDFPSINLEEGFLEGTCQGGSAQILLMAWEKEANTGQDLLI